MSGIGHAPRVMQLATAGASPGKYAPPMRCLDQRACGLCEAPKSIPKEIGSSYALSLL
jgi:hypothetical protein